MTSACDNTIFLTNEHPKLQCGGRALAFFAFLNCGFGGYLFHGAIAFRDSTRGKSDRFCGVRPPLVRLLLTLPCFGAAHYPLSDKFFSFISSFLGKHLLFLLLLIAVPLFGCRGLSQGLFIRSVIVFLP